jgi:hypothetical protein
MRALVLALLPRPALAQGVPVPQFTEETATAGLSTVYAGDWEYMVGGGVAAFDCSGDGQPELLLPGGSGTAALYRNLSAPGGALRFEAVAGSGLEVDAVLGAYPLDIDADGVMDLIVLRLGENLAMRGLGDCRFAQANDAWGFDGGDAWSTAFAATWERGADWPTLAVGNYVDRFEESFPWGSCTDNWLHRPGAPGRFAPPLPLTPSHCALSILFTDWNRSGTPSLRVSNDREYYKGGQEQLWRLDPGAPPVLYTPEEGWQRLRIWGMGIASQDLDGDGYPEFYLTSMADNKLQALTAPGPGARPEYTDVAWSRGITAHRPFTGGDLRPSTAWHAEFGDVNNDGLSDLLVVKGNVAEMPDFAAKDPNNLFLQRPDGRFDEASDRAGVLSFETGRGGALVDLNADGALDLVVVNRWSGAQVWRNAGGGFGAVQVMLAQPGANRHAIGAWLEWRQGDRILRREITVGGGHAGGQAGWLHLGAGAAGAVDLRVIWPEGTEGDWHRLSAGGRWVLEPGAEPRAWSSP